MRLPGVLLDVKLLTIEQGRAVLIASLSQFNTQLSHIAGPHFSTADDRPYRKQKEREAAPVNERERAARDQLALENSYKHMRGQDYERTFEKVVRSGTRWMPRGAVWRAATERWRPRRTTA